MDMDKSPAVSDGARASGPGTAKMTNGRVPPSSDTSAGNGLPPGSQPGSQRTSQQSSANTSATHSPLASRDSSPTRKPQRTTSASRLSGSRSRNSSQQDLSPTRQMRSSLSGRTSSSRSLSSTVTPSLPPASQDPQIQAPTPQKPSTLDAKDISPRWPVSPRLRSPPPQLNKPTPAPAPSRRNELDPPTINVQRPTPSPHPVDSSQNTTSESDTEDSQLPSELPSELQSGIRTPARGALETVQEVSLPNSPSPRSDAALMAQVKEKLENQSDSALNDVRTLKDRPTVPSTPGLESEGGDTSSTRNEPRRSTSVPPPLAQRQSSAMSFKQSKAKQDNSTQNMTVETETVASIPQVTLATGTKAESTSGTLKPKPSTETIKPKKEKKKTTRKQPAVSSGNASSKADIFEAKIASAVDEANTSDSEETFVYDSNPPDAGDRSARRFHSRTPSATSMVSQADRANLRSIYSVMDPSGPTHGPKKGMKFVNTLNSNGAETTTEDDGKGTGRSVGGSARGTARHHHHIGRWGRQPGNSHPSLFDNESPFPNAAKSKLNGHQSRNSSGPPSPRNHHTYGGLHHKRSNYQMSSYDHDDTTGADDERTPLMGSTRRSGRTRRGPHSLRQTESQSFNRQPSYLNRFAACLVLTMMLLLVITGAIGFMFATSQPMSDIEIVSIKNVVTSEQVLMFDLTVKAHNPNIVVVTVDQANLEVFAKSEHAGTDSDWWKMPHGPDEIHISDDPINDPPPDDDDDDDSRPNVLLGRITEFDSPLTFEGSLFHKGTSSSTGELQLGYPGNGTSGGSERWERIYQDEFDLIVKGVVKYSLPLSARVRSSTVAGRTHVKPNSANDPSLKPNTTLDTWS